jgi:hypothetical protein
VNAKRNPAKHRVGVSLALISLLVLAASCGPVLPTGPSLDATHGTPLSRAAQSDLQIADGEDTDGGGAPVTVSGTTTESPYSPGTRLGQGGTHKPPKKPKKH